jgi:predicted TPR repeat methyltransferase
MNDPARSEATASPNVALQAAAEHYRAGRLGEAEGIYRGILQADPNNAAAMHGMGLVALQVGKHDVAVACLRRSLAIDPRRPEAHAALGTALVRMRQFSDAVPSLQSALNLGMDQTDIHYHLAVALLRLNRFSESEAAARKALQSNPSSAEIWQTLGESIGNQRRPQEAINSFRKAISLKPDLPMPHYALGLTLGQIGRLDEAIVSLRSAIRLRPEYPEALTLLGTILLFGSHLEEAIQTLVAAIRLRPTDLDSYLDLARAYELARRPDEAVHTLEKILEFSPDDPKAKFYLAALTGRNVPPASPPAQLAEVFDRYAQTFDQHLTGKLQYHFPRLLVDALARAGVNGKFDTLDLGCGTGLCGVEIRPIARTLSGIDLSPAMIEKARERGIYDHLEVGEVVAGLRARSAAYDLLVAGEVLCYIGDLAPLFQAAATALRPGGSFIFSVEKSDVPGWMLRPSCRYAHHPDYLRQIASASGFTILGLESIVVRVEGGEKIAGLLGIVRLPTPPP